MSESTAAARIQRLVDQFNKGQFPQVIAGARLLLVEQPRLAVLYSLIGASHAAQGEHELSMRAFGSALALEPNSADTHCNLANAEAAQGLLVDAANGYRRALVLNPGMVQAANGLGNALRQMGQTEAALKAFDDALACQPDYAEATFNRATALHDLGRLDEALRGYDSLLSLIPQLAIGHWHRGRVLMSMGDAAAAISACELAIAADPQLAGAHVDIGHAYLTLGMARKAESHLRAALQIAPSDPRALLNMGFTLHQLGDLTGAEAAYRTSLSIDPSSALAHNNLGSVLQEAGRPVEAFAAFEQALAITPDDMNIRISKLHQQAQICDWRAYAEFAELGDHLMNPERPAPPWQVLAFDDNPMRNRRLSEIWAKGRFPQPDSAAPRPDISNNPAKRIRVGYFSADFHEHATMHLLGGMMALHDRSRFEITAFSFSPERDDPVRRKLIEDVEHFLDVKDLSDLQIAKLAQSRGIDIAVDLKGYTMESRPGVFAYRAAPVQVSYLGYPGTSGAPFMDYLIGDGIVCTPKNRAAFSESLIELAGSYQVNDRNRAIAETVPPRSQFGLPDDGFVFGCFNNTFKIGPAEFAIWMRLLRAVDGSVLWLLGTNSAAKANLRREAQAQGVDPGRVVFAERQQVNQHLARHRHIDLFLDTFNYNAHTTASDALWAGVPVLTKAGEGFAARVAASLLHAVGLPDLVTHDQEAYEALALALASDPPRLAALKARLAENRLTHPLFDTALFARRLESAYAAIADRAMKGEPPADVAVD